MFLPLGSLSGGERVRARLVRIALAVETCDVLLLDEPSNHLDALAQDALVELVESFPGACLVVTHDEAFAARFAWDDVLGLEGGPEKQGARA